MITKDTDPKTAVLYHTLGCKFKIRLTQDNGPGKRIGVVLDWESGEEMGVAQDYTYEGKAFAVHTKPFAGCVSLDQIEFVE